MNISNYIKLVIKELIYMVITMIFLIRLNILNKILLEEVVSQNPFELLMYEKCLPLKYFVGAIILVIAGIVLIIFRCDQMKKENIELGEMVCSIIILILTIMFISLIIYFINNPILRAVLMAVCAAIGVLSLVSNN